MANSCRSNHFHSNRTAFASSNVCCWCADVCLCSVPEPVVALDRLVSLFACKMIQEYLIYLCSFACAVRLVCACVSLVINPSIKVQSSWRVNSSSFSWIQHWNVYTHIQICIIYTFLSLILHLSTFACAATSLCIGALNTLNSRANISL